MNAFRTSITSALLALLMAGTAPAMAADIVIALGSEPSTLDPQLRDDGGERAISDNVYETLMARTPTGELVPSLAAEAPTQVDATTWEFKLKPGISFTNGEPFNADAAVYSIERVINPEFKSEQGSYYGSITGATKVDDLTVRVLTSGPDPILPSRLYWMKMVPPVYSTDPAFAEAPIGTGPYKFVSWARGQDIVLEENPDYWGDDVNVDKVTFRFLSEAGTRLSGLLAGELDIIVNLLPEFVPSVPKAVAVNGLETSVMILSTENETTAPAQVREALNIAIDREAIATSIFGGYATPAKGQLVNPAAFGFNPALEPYPYDPARAKQLITDAGAAGKVLTLVGESGRWLKDRELIEAVAAYWSEAGLTVNVEIEEFGTFLTRLFDRNVRPDVVFVVNSNELLDADRETSFAYQMGGAAASNMDEELSAWVDAARVETDTAKRAELYAQITQRAHDNNYLVPLLNMQDIYGISQRITWQPRTDAKLMVKEMVAQ